MGKTLSIVVPAYNVERYLSQCLDSMIIKEFLRNIEVLIINDGSNDRTEMIAQKYCELYPETFHIYNKENGGHGSAINYGIKYATGKYFKVVDGDDWLNTKELMAFIDLLMKRTEDIIASDYLCIEDNSGRILAEKYAAGIKHQCGQAALFENGDIKNVIKMHALTIRTEILQKNQVTIDEHCYYVDCEYITYPIPFVKSVYYDPHFIYMYRLGRNGQSVDIKSMQRNRAQHEKVLKQLLKFYENLPEDISEEKKIYIEKAIGQVMENQFQIYISMGCQKGIRQELKSWDRRLKEKYPRIYAVTKKKSIYLLRKTDYRILRLGNMIYSVARK